MELLNEIIHEWIGNRQGLVCAHMMVGDELWLKTHKVSLIQFEIS
jgi:hypothetical protein